jgi:hypothetical protein
VTTPMRTALATALLALVSCSADLQIDRVCATGAVISFPAAPIVPVTAVPVPATRLSFAFGDAVPDLSKNGVHDVQVLARSLDLTSTLSTDFVTSLTVAVVPPAGSALTQKTVGTYQRPAGGAGSVLSVTADGTDLFPYMESGLLTLEVSGEADPSRLPPTASTVGTTACAEVQGSVNYFKAAGL